MSNTDVKFVSMMYIMGKILIWNRKMKPHKQNNIIPHCLNINVLILNINSIMSHSCRMYVETHFFTFLKFLQFIELGHKLNHMQMDSNWKHKWHVNYSFTQITLPSISRIPSELYFLNSRTSVTLDTILVFHFWRIFHEVVASESSRISMPFFTWIPNTLGPQKLWSFVHRLIPFHCTLFWNKRKILKLRRGQPHSASPLANVSLIDFLAAFTSQRQNNESWKRIWQWQFRVWNKIDTLMHWCDWKWNEKLQIKQCQSMLIQLNQLTTKTTFYMMMHCFWVILVDIEWLSKYCCHCFQLVLITVFMFQLIQMMTYVMFIALNDSGIDQNMICQS